MKSYICCILLLLNISLTKIPQREYQYSVGYISISSGKGNGSGVLISPNHILTCKHVLTWFNEDNVIKNYPHYFIINGKNCEIKDYIVFDDLDLAIARIDESFSEYADISDKEVNDSILFNVAYKGEWYKRMYTNKFTGIHSNGVYFYKLDYDTPLDSIPEPGNSGGGVFQEQEGSIKLVGIIANFHSDSEGSVYGGFVFLGNRKLEIMEKMKQLSKPTGAEIEELK